MRCSRQRLSLGAVAKPLCFWKNCFVRSEQSVQSERRHSGELLTDFSKEIALFPIQVGKSFCYFNFKMAFRFLHCKRTERFTKLYGNSVLIFRLLRYRFFTIVFYDFFKMISGNEVEKLSIYAIVIHRSGLSC